MNLFISYIYKMEVKVAGVSYNQTAVSKVKKNQVIRLEEEDSEAIKVMNGDELLGYIPKDRKQEVNAYKKENKKYTTTISKVVKWKHDDGDEQIALRVMLSKD